MSHKYKIDRVTEWGHSFVCKNCGKTRSFVPEAHMTLARLAELDKQPCLNEVVVSELSGSSLGVSGITKVHFRHVGEMYEARMGVALLGSTNMSEKDLKKCDYNPFHEEFQDNFVQGFGYTEQEATDALLDDQRKMSASLWAGG